VRITGKVFDGKSDRTAIATTNYLKVGLALTRNFYFAYSSCFSYPYSPKEVRTYATGYPVEGKVLRRLSSQADYTPADTEPVSSDSPSLTVRDSIKSAHEIVPSCFTFSGSFIGW
jgi:hypothetical protein